MTPCWLQQFSLAPCDGPMDPAHLVPKQRLRNAGINPEDRWDRRAIVPACRRHHHLFDQKFMRIPLEEYPSEFIDYCTEHGLYWNGQRDGWRVEHRGAA
jgi:hypothetical protein